MYQNIQSGGYSRDKKEVFLEFQIFSYRFEKIKKISFDGL